MAKKAQRAPARVDPGRVLMARLAELATKGADPARMRRTVEDTVAGWNEEPPDELRDRVESMRDALAEGLEAAAEQVDDMDRSDAAGLKAAQKSLEALRAAHAALAAAHGSIQG